MGATVALTSAGLKTLAEEMRKQNPEPTFEMNYSEYAAASGVYAMITGLESLAKGLKAEEKRQHDEMLAAWKRESEFQRRWFNAETQA